jgi:hypothetical protein
MTPERHRRAAQLQARTMPLIRAMIRRQDRRDAARAEFLRCPSPATRRAWDRAAAQLVRARRRLERLRAAVALCHAFVTIPT